jgi:uncharacterized heparinase superfamily protein
MVAAIQSVAAEWMAKFTRKQIINWAAELKSVARVVHWINHNTKEEQKLIKYVWW